MINTLRKYLFAVALFPQEAPLAKRLEILGRHLKPKPGGVSAIDPVVLRDRGVVTKYAEKLGGIIMVTPPKGQCFSITTSPLRQDIEACRPTPVKWMLEEIDPATGTFTWKIRTSPQDFGTQVSWKVPYVIAKTLPPEAEFFKANSTPVYFKSCVPTLANGDTKPRQITLTKFDNKKWIIRFPETDETVKSQKINRMPELFEELPQKKKEEQKSAANAGEQGGAGEQAEAAKVPPPPKKETPIEDSDPWNIGADRAYEMNVGNFLSAGSMPPGKKGYCRYHYDMVAGDFSRGHVECHRTDEFLYMYVVLPCMQPIMPKPTEAPKPTDVKK